jgi:fatty acid desaturase
MALGGTACVGMYIAEAIVARVGDPDQSLLFWYLPILFIGLAGLVAGVGLGIWGFGRLRAMRSSPPGGK